MRALGYYDRCCVEKGTITMEQRRKETDEGDKRKTRSNTGLQRGGKKKKGDRERATAPKLTTTGSLAHGATARKVQRKRGDPRPVWPWSDAVPTIRSHRDLMPPSHTEKGRERNHSRITTLGKAGKGEISTHTGKRKCMTRDRSTKERASLPSWKGMEAR